MFARRTAEGILQHITGYTAIFAEPTAYVAFFTTAPSDDSGAGAVEVSGGAYARVATSAGTWAAATAFPPLIANLGAAVTFATATASWGTLVAVGLYDAATGGNLLAWDWLGLNAWRPCTLSVASPAVVTLPGHDIVLGQNLAFSTVFGGTAPGISQGSLAGLLAAAAPLGNDSFTLTSGGTAVNTSTTGSGMIRRVTPLSVVAGLTPLFPAGMLALVMGYASQPLAACGAGIGRGRGTGAYVIPLAGRAKGGSKGTAVESTLTGGSGTVLGTGTSATDALGTGTAVSDLIGVS